MIRSLKDFSDYLRKPKMMVIYLRKKSSVLTIYTNTDIFGRVVDPLVKNYTLSFNTEEKKPYNFTKTQ